MDPRRHVLDLAQRAAQSDDHTCGNCRRSASVRWRRVSGPLLEACGVLPSAGTTSLERDVCNPCYVSGRDVLAKGPICPKCGTRVVRLEDMGEIAEDFAGDLRCSPCLKDARRVASAVEARMAARIVGKDAQLARLRSQSWRRGKKLGIVNGKRARSSPRRSGVSSPSSPSSSGENSGPRRRARLSSAVRSGDFPLSRRDPRYSLRLTVFVRVGACEQTAGCP